jgi:CRISPR-associated endonuclease/helicase Cas3
MSLSHVLYRNGKFLDQSNEEHSKGVSRRAEQFATGFGFGDYGRVMGLLHDIGKEQKAFQARIRRSTGLEPGIPPRAPHAFVGALVAKKLYPNSWPFVSWSIMGHHAGLFDQDKFESSMEMEIPQEITSDIIDGYNGKGGNLPLPSLPYKLSQEDFNHLGRLLFSCLVDADYLDTEEFMSPDTAKIRGNKTTLQELLPLLDRKLDSFKADTPVNIIRKEILLTCNSKAESDRGFYSMTVPTGGGKTLTSLSWALRHAIHNGQNRVIIAIPYTSIITQTAAILKDIFGERNVLEHHSNVVAIPLESSEDEKMEEQRRKLATENWDYPIIVTTNVQLFESMFSNRPSACRKLHNICNSVILLDEVQTLPTDFLQPIIDALKTYHNCFGCSVLFTTASMPVLSKDKLQIESLKGIDHVAELIPQKMNLSQRLKRVDIKVDETLSEYNDIAERMTRENRTLCIVNTRKDAKAIYQLLPHEGLTLHLSRMMCQAHIAKTIALIKKALKDNEKQTIRVVATQLIEAGVDIDFPSVFRQKAGLDSILQAAGRCNREGRMATHGITHVFDIRGTRGYGSIKNARNAFDNLITQDLQSQQAMTDYFNQLYIRSIMDKAGVCEELYGSSGIRYETAAQKFKLIDDSGIGIIVPYDHAEMLIDELKRKSMDYSLIKRLQPYTVSVREQDFKALMDMGALVKIDNVYWLEQSDLYDMNIGLTFENKWLEEPLIVD